MYRTIPVPLSITRGFLALVLALLVPVAVGQQLEIFAFSNPEPGTKLTYRNLATGITTTRKYLESDSPYKNRYRIGSAKPRDQYLFCKYCGSSKNEIDLPGYQNLFPLEVGKTTEFRRWKKSKPETSWTHTITVQEVRQVKSQVEASPQDVFVIYEEIINNQKDWKGSVTYWFSPQLKSNISIIDNAADNPDQVEITQLIGAAQP